MSEKRAARWVMVIVAVAVVLRAVVAIVHPFWFPDSADYDALGRAIAHGWPYEVNGLWATRMPGYPVLVGAVYALGGSVRAVLLVQAVMGGVSTWLVYLIGRRVSVGVGLVAAGLAAVDPLSVGFSAALLSEAAFTVLMLLALWMLILVINKPLEPAPWWIAAGVVWGVAVYMRASALWCIVPLACWVGGRIMVVGGTRKWITRGLTVAGWMVIPVLGVLIPWQHRNYALFHEKLFRLTTLEGISLYEAVYPGADGGPKQDIIPLPPAMAGMNESQRDVAWGRMAWAEVRGNPGRVLGLAVRKMGRTWSPWMNAAEFRSGAIQAGMVLWQVPLFILAVMGIASRRMGWPMKGLLLIPIGYFTAVHALFLGSVRYRVPLMPLVCIFAAVGVMAIARRWGIVNVRALPGSSDVAPESP